MRLMSLVDLGASESGHIPYDLIKLTLQVSGCSSKFPYIHFSDSSRIPFVPMFIADC